MAQRNNESLSAYKSRVIDPISSSFCGAKWYNATIWLSSGTTASCHHPPAHQCDPEEVKINYTAIHNTSHKKEQRKLMLEGKYPSECDYCWRMEQINPGIVSDRVFKSVIYSDTDLQKLKKLPSDTNINLKTLEISFDRKCSCGCSYCNASYSSVWANDVVKNGPYPNLVSDGAKAFQQDGSWTEPYNNEADNPYIKAFWEWWPQLSKSLQELRVTGGEPLLSSHTWTLFSRIKEDQLKLLFSINSNLCLAETQIDLLIDKINSINSFDLYTSIESTGSLAEYVRDGMEYNQFIANVNRILKESKVRTVHFMMTIDALSLWGMCDFLDKVILLKKEYGPKRIYCSVNLLRFPSFMSPLALPENIKQERMHHLTNWCNLEKPQNSLSEGEFATIERLIDYLKKVKDPHGRTSSKDTLSRDFKTFYEEYDRRRNKNHQAIFPKALLDWMNTIPETIIDETELIEGAVTDWVLDPKDENPR